MDPQEKLTQWQADEAAMRASLGAAGVALGSVHGGYAATLLDSCVGCAIHTMLPAGKGYTTLELKINFIRPLTDKTGPVRAEGKVIHLGGQTGIAEGRITDVNGKLYAFATTTCLIFPI